MKRLDSVESTTPEINIDGVPESSTNELPLSAISFKSSRNPPLSVAGGELLDSESATNELPLSSPVFARHAASPWTGAPGPGLAPSLPHPSPVPSPPLTLCAPPLEAGAARRQRHSIAGQMSYFKMLGFGLGGAYGRNKLGAGGGSTNSLFSTAVISGSSSAPNLRDMIPNTASSSTLDGFGGVPPIRPLETLHNALSLKQLDVFLEQMTSIPLFRTPASSPPKHPSTPLPTQLRKRPSPTNSVGWSGPPSLLSSCGGPASAGSSSGPSSPNCLSDFCERASSDNMSTSQMSADGYGALGLPSMSHIFPELDQELSSVAADLDADLYPTFGSHSHGLVSSVTGLGLVGIRNTSGDITPVSTSSEWEFNTNEATIGSTTEHDITGTEEDEEEETTISAETSFTAGDQDISLSNSSINNDPARTTFKPLAVPSAKVKSDLATSLSSSVEHSNYIANYEQGLCDNVKHMSPICVKPTPLRKASNDLCISQNASVSSSQSVDANILQSDPSTLVAREYFIEPAKMARISKSFHGKSQSSSVTLAHRRASEGLSIDTSSSALDRHSPSKYGTKLPQDSSVSGASPKKSISRFTTTPVSDSVFSLKTQAVTVAKPNENLSNPKVTMSTDTSVTQGFNIDSNTNL